MRVVVVHNHPIHYKQLLFNELARRGVDLTVLYLARKSKQRLQDQYLSNSSYSYAIGSEGFYESVSKVRTSWYVLAHLRHLQPDAVILGGYCDAAVWAAWAWSIVRRRPRVLWAETNKHDRPRVWWKEALKRVFLAGCHGAQVYGQNCKSYLADLGMSPDRIQIKRAVVDTLLFQPAKEENHSAELRALYVGRFSPEKNVSFLISAFSKACSFAWGRQLRLVLVGYGPLEHRVREAVVRCGTPERFEIVPGVPHERMPEYFGRSDVLVLPSVREPYGLVVLEAMASGLPVVVSSSCGCVPDVVSRSTGWVFSPYSEQQLIEVLQSISLMPKAGLCAMGVAARAVALEYSGGRSAERVKRGLECLLTGATWRDD